MCEDGWRETMVGTIGFYDRDGERQHTIYLAATPEYGKATFLDRLEREIGRVRAAYPQARYVGLADGAKGNWEFLGRHTAVQVIDFWHAAEYLSDAADALFAREPGAKRPWLESSCHRLKHEPGAARQLIRDLKRLAAEKGVARITRRSGRRSRTSPTRARRAGWTTPRWWNRRSRSARG